MDDADSPREGDDRSIDVTPVEEDEHGEQEKGAVVVDGVRADEEQARGRHCDPLVEGQRAAPPGPHQRRHGRSRHETPHDDRGRRVGPEQGVQKADRRDLVECVDIGVGLEQGPDVTQPCGQPCRSEQQGIDRPDTDSADAGCTHGPPVAAEEEQADDRKGVLGSKQQNRDRDPGKGFTIVGETPPDQSDEEERERGVLPAADTDEDGIRGEGRGQGE